MTFFDILFAGLQLFFAILKCHKKSLENDCGNSWDIQHIVYVSYYL